MARDYLGWGGRAWREEAGVTGPRLHSASPSPTLPRAGQGRAGQRPVGEGEGRAGRPLPRPPRPLSREEERVAPRPRDVERSRDDEARSSRARGCGTGGVRLLRAQGPASVSHPPAPMSTSISSLFSDHTLSEPSVHPHQLDIHALAQTLTDTLSQALPLSEPQRTLPP